MKEDINSKTCRIIEDLINIIEELSQEYYLKSNMVAEAKKFLEKLNNL